jgi:LuxR family maltose regulon positive regulatory protein
MYVCGETNLLINWIDELGVEELRKRPRLLWAQAWSLTTTGRVAEAQSLLDRYDRADRDDDTPRDSQEEALLLAVRSRIAAYRGDSRAAIVLGEQSLKLLDTENLTRTHGDVVLSLGFAHRSLGHTREAAAHFAEAARLGRQYGNVQAARWGVRYLAVTRMSEGRLNEAEALIDEDLERVRRESADPGSILSALLVGKAEILYQRNRCTEAHAALDKAIPLIQGMGDAKMLSNAYAAMGRLLQAEGHHLHAREKMRRSEELLTMLVPGANVAMMALAQGDLAGAERWARMSGFSVDDEPDSTRGEFEQETFARIMLAVEPGPATFGLIDRLIADSDASGRFGRSLELHLARAEAAWRYGRPGEARTSVLQALRIARDEGFIRPFLNHGAPMQAILRDLVRERDVLDAASRAFALSLIAAAGNETDAATGADTLIEALTDRQAEILRLLADGQSNRDIADRLSIAEGTVKAHMHQLFGKLAARNRTEAVANARQLQLLG